jgi:hypothetical protein
VVAGKGHETGQKVGDVTFLFDDVEELAGAISTAIALPASVTAAPGGARP